MSWPGVVEQGVGERGHIVTGVEDEQRSRVRRRETPTQRLDLLGGDARGVLIREDTPDLDRRRPAIPLEAELGDPLVGPALDDGLAIEVARGVVVITTRGACLRRAARPDADVDGVDRLGGGGRALRQERPQSFLVQPAMLQGGVKAAPAAPVGGSQAQVGERGLRAGGEDGVAQLEERVGAPVQATIEAGAEVT